MYFVRTILHLYRQNKRKMSKPERERRTVKLPDVRLYPSELSQLRQDASQHGYAKKLATYIRIKLFGGKISQPEKGMSMDDVMLTIQDIRLAGTHAKDNLALQEIHQRIAQRCMQTIIKK